MPRRRGAAAVSEVFVELGSHRSRRRKRRRRGYFAPPSPNGQRPAPGPQSPVVVTGLPEPAAPVSQKAYEDLTSIDPQPRLTLEYPGCPPSCRLIDLFCPIGRGQRGLIVSPPKAGKTTLLKDIASAIIRNHPD